jgi:hypothetical protein
LISLRTTNTIKKLNRLINAINRKWWEWYFPAVKEQASRIINSLAVILGIDLSALKAMDYYEVLKTAIGHRPEYRVLYFSAHDCVGHEKHSLLARAFLLLIFYQTVLILS